MPWRRRPFREKSVSRALNIGHLREIASRSVPHFVFEYVEGGAEDEASLRCNRSAFESYRFVPQTLVNTTARHHRTQLFGREIKAPLVIAPTGMNGILRHDGDLQLARAAAAAGIPFCLSTVSTTRLERVAAEAGGRLWMQLYVMKDRKVAENIVSRAHAAGFEALVFTTDANVFGYREWDRRNYARPGRPTLRNMLDMLRHPRWLQRCHPAKRDAAVRELRGVPAAGRRERRSAAARSFPRCSAPTSPGTISRGCEAIGTASCSSKAC